MTRKQHPWYRFDKLASFNAVFNFAVGGRGIGKTFGAKEMVIKKFLKKKEQFILLRRYTTELSTRDTFFADVGERFPDYDFRVFGHLAQCSPVKARADKRRSWETMGFFVALTKAQAQKGTSFHRVTTIIFDEFILEKSVLHYLPDEAQIMLNFYSTVDRGQDKTRVYFLANSVSMMNPYFIEYDLRPDEVGEFVIKYDGFVAAQFIDSKDYADSLSKTRFGKFIRGTEYEKYAVTNEFSDAHHEMVEAKPETAKYMYTLETKSGTFAVWYDHVSGEYFAQQKRPKQETVLTMVSSRMDDGKRLVNTSDQIISTLRTSFRYARIAFDSPVTRNMFVEVFKQ